MGERSSSWWRRATYRNPGEPGPAFRYLYVQPTARSVPAASSSTETAPAEWHRSHRTSAPAATAHSATSFTPAATPSVTRAAPGLPPALGAAIDRCLKPDPGDRFADGEALAVASALLIEPVTTTFNPSRTATSRARRSSSAVDCG